MSQRNINKHISDRHKIFIFHSRSILRYLKSIQNRNFLESFCVRAQY
jgi:hypothetical protein